MHADEAWIGAWLDDVVSGKATMSQRALSSIERHGGVDRVIAAARERDVHLVQLEDDKGKIVVAASLKPFRTLC